MAQEGSQSAGENGNMHLFSGVQIPPLRSFNEFILEKSRFEMPPFRDLPKWNNRMLSNLLYFQTNYFIFMIIMIILSASVQFHDIAIGLGAIALLGSALFFSLSSNPTFVQLRREHTLVTLGVIAVASYCFIYAIVPVISVMFTIALPILLILIHSSIRLRGLRVKINQQLERIGFKNTLMAALLDRCGVPMKIGSM